MIFITFKNENTEIAKFELEELIWLTDRKVLKKGNSGDIESDSPDTLPHNGIYELTLIDITKMHDFCKKQLFLLKATPGFKSKTVDKFIFLINTGLETKKSFEVVGE